MTVAQELECGGRNQLPTVTYSKYSKLSQEESIGVYEESSSFYILKVSNSYGNAEIT